MNAESAKSKPGLSFHSAFNILHSALGFIHGRHT
jgi:hypothetical protein